MHSNYIYQYILRNSVNLTPTEQLISNYLLEHWDQEFIGKTIATSLGISQASVSKYIKKMNFKSIYELNNLKTYENFEIVNYLMIKKNEILKQTIDYNQESLLTNVVSEFTNKQELYVYGIGHSYIAAYNFYQRFNRIGYNVTLLRERNDVTMHTNKITNKNSFTIIFSDSGTTQEIINFCSFLKQNNAEYLLITSNPLTLAARQAKYILTYSSTNIGYLLESIGPEEPMIFIIDLLYLISIYDNYDFALNNYLHSETYTLYS